MSKLVGGMLWEGDVMVAILKGIYRKASRFYHLIKDTLWFLFHGFGFKCDCRLNGSPFIRASGKGSKIKIGKRFAAVSNMRHNSFGIWHRVSIRTTWPGAVIEIGDDVGVSGCAISARNSIKIGNNVLIGAGALIADNDSHPIDPNERLVGGPGVSKPIVIEDNVFIGARAIVLKGVTIGHDSTVGAGAVVTKNVPPFTVVAGNPAKVVREIKH